MIYFIYATESGAAWSTRTRIWESDRVDVTTESNYYPVIYDGQCSLEMGKAGTLKFTIAPDHPYYSQFRKKKTILTVIQIDAAPGSKWADISSEVNGSNCIFRGAVDEISVDVFQQATISATDLLISLEDSLHVPSGKSKVKKTRRAWFEQALADHNSQMTSEPEKKFTLGTVDSFQGKAANENEVSDTSYTETMSFIKSNVMDQCNGYLRVRYSDNFATHYLDLVETYGTTASQQFKFAVNIADVSHEDISDDLYTVLVPVGKNAKTIEGASGTRTTKYLDMDGTWKNVTVRINGKYIEIPDAIANYGYIYSPVSFSDKSSVDDIISESLKHISSTYHADNFTLSVKAIDMNHLDSNQKIVHLGDKITVIRYSKVNQDGSLVDRRVNAMCSAINYDLISPENTEYTIGTNFENMTKGGGSSGGGGGSSGGGGGGYGGFNECIGHMVGDMAVIDHTVTQINGDLLEVNTSITRINSDIIDLAGRVKITEDFISTTYAENTSIINWTYNNVQNWDGTFGEMYEQWIEFTGSQVYQTQDQWSSFVGLWYATYGPNGEFLGFVYRDGGGLFVEEDGVRVGLFKEGDLTGGMVVEALEDGTVTTKIRGDLIDITANKTLNLMVQSLVDDSDPNNPKMDYSGISIGRNQVSFGFYEASGTGPQELSAGILVNKLSDGSTTTKIKSTYIDFEGIVTADYINSLFNANTYFNADYASVNNIGVHDNFYIYQGLSPYNILESGHTIMDAVIAFDQDNISYQGNTIKIPYKTLGNASTWQYLTFNNVTSVTGKWGDGVFRVLAGTKEVLQTSINLRYGNTDSTQQWYPGQWLIVDGTTGVNTKYYTYVQVRNEKSEQVTQLFKVESGNVFQKGLESATADGKWDGQSFKYWVADNRTKTEKQTSVTIRWGTYQSGGSWQQNTWAKNSNDQYITYAEARNPQDGLIILTEVNANSVFNEGLKAATVTGQWNRLTFQYWNAQNKPKSNIPSTTVTLKYGVNSDYDNNNWTTNSSGKPITYAQIYAQINNSSAKIGDPFTITGITKGLFIDSLNKKIVLSEASSTEELSIAVAASLSYNSTSHKYTPTGTATIGTSTFTATGSASGTEAFNDGIDAGANRVSFIDAAEATSSNVFNLTKNDQVYGIQANYKKSDGTSVLAKMYYVKTPPAQSSESYTEGYTNSWTVAHNMVSYWPELGANEERWFFYSQVPASTVDNYTNNVIRVTTPSTASASGYAEVSVSEYGSSSGKVYARVPIGTWYTAGYTNSWAISHGMVAYWPELGANEERWYFYAEVPAATVDNYTNNVIQLTTPATASADGYAEVTVSEYGASSGKVYARVPIGTWYTAGYNAGWATARGCVLYWPDPLGTDEERASFYVQQPAQAVDNYENREIVLTTGTPKKSGYASIMVRTPGTTNGNVYAKVSIGEWYQEGWNKARASSGWPVQDTASTNTFKVYRPSSTVDGSAETRKYHIASESSVHTDSEGVKRLKIFAYYDSISNKVATLDLNIANIVTAADIGVTPESHNNRFQLYCSQVENLTNGGKRYRFTVEYTATAPSPVAFSSGTTYNFWR